MCGISGFIDFTNNSSKEILKRMSDTLAHRGPDGFGEEFFEKDNFQIGLGHRRLSIIDLSEAGKQPMQYKNLHIVFNGEIYNYQEIKNELQALGHSFISHSDTEVILHAYEQWHENCLQKFTGMFAFVIYDEEKNNLFCARDRAGIKPFFYYFKNNLFLFASELKAFHQHPEFEKEIDTNALALFMQHGNIPAPHCIFKNCFKLKPAHFMRFQTANCKLQIQQYWNVYDAYNKPKLTISFDEAKTETEKILAKAFEYRMVSDVPVGVFLSGGYDSACLTALLQKNNTEKLKTFTIAMPDIGLNEAPYAKDIANYLGTEHTEIDCTQKDALDLIHNLPFYYDEPFADSSAIPTTLVSKIARKQVTVALSADGGDEVFAGYNRYDYLMKHGNFLNKIPAPFRKSMLGMMNVISADKIPYFKNTYNFHNRYEKLKRLLNNPSPKNMMLNLSKQFESEQLNDFLKTSFEELETAYLSEELKKEFYSPLAYMQATDYQTYLPDDILQKVDRASMSQSLEAREPFLDHHIIEWAAQLPDDFKYHKGIKKYILKEIVHAHIPKKLMDRPKMGFAIPIEQWLMNDLKDLVLHYLSDEKIASQNIFNPNAVSKLKSDFFSGKKELAAKIWYLLMFEMWYEKWG
ncbi:MAG: asparagine synthase (glutamine-hydrolyzing) [Bacteroidetes bacterium]|nr:asparagine synthase (glutamine-hydrolyzing) [Bacteroidota bacterium]